MLSINWKKYFLRDRENLRLDFWFSIMYMHFTQAREGSLARFPSTGRTSHGHLLRRLALGQYRSHRTRFTADRRPTPGTSTLPLRQEVRTAVRRDNQRAQSQAETRLVDRRGGRGWRTAHRSRVRGRIYAKQRRLFVNNAECCIKFCLFVLVNETFRCWFIYWIMCFIIIIINNS